MRCRTKTVITLETWRRTTVKFARKTISTEEPALDRHQPSQDIYRIAPQENDKFRTRADRQAGKQK